MPQQTEILRPPRERWYRRLLASPRYLVLVIAGILIVGGAAAFGVDQLASDDEGGTATAALPGGEGKAALIFLDRLKITRIEQVDSVDALRAALAPAAP